MYVIVCIIVQNNTSIPNTKIMIRALLLTRPQNTISVLLVLFVCFPWYISTRDKESKYYVLKLSGIILGCIVMVPTICTLSLICFTLFSNLGHDLLSHPLITFSKNMYGIYTVLNSKLASVLGNPFSFIFSIPCFEFWI